MSIDPLVLYLIRHGETEWSASGRHTGRTDIALTANGESDARALAPGLAAIRFAHVFTSPLQRALQTCSLAGLGASAERISDLAEWDYGDYEGLRTADIRAIRPGWTVYRDGCPGGESSADVAGRADRLIFRLRSLGGNIALFSHGQFCCSFSARWIGLAIEQSRHLMMLGTGSVGVLGFSQSDAEIPVIRQWNIAV